MMFQNIGALTGLWVLEWRQFGEVFLVFSFLKCSPLVTGVASSKTCPASPNSIQKCPEGSFFLPSTLMGKVQNIPPWAVMPWGKSERHLGHGLGQGPPRNPPLASWSSVHAIILFQWGSIQFSPHFSRVHILDNSRKNKKRSRWSCWASSVGVLCSQGGLWMSTVVTHGPTPERWGDVAASVTDLWVPQKGNWIAERFCTLAVFLFQAGEILVEVHYPALNVWFQYFDIAS